MATAPAHPARGRVACSGKCCVLLSDASRSGGWGVRQRKNKKIEEVLESVRPMLQRDHGDVELADVQGKKIYVHLKGACSGCMMEAATLGGIQQKMIETLGELVQVLPSSHMPAEA